MKIKVPRDDNDNDNKKKKKIDGCTIDELPWLWQRGIPISKIDKLFPALRAHTAIRLDDKATRCLIGQLTRWTVVPREIAHSGDTIVVMGQLKGGKNKVYSVVLKMGLREEVPERHLIQEMEYERRIYRQLINPMVAQRFTPNLMLYLGDLVCNASVLERAIQQKRTRASREFIYQLTVLRRHERRRRSTCMITVVMEGLQQYTTVNQYIEETKKVSNVEQYNSAKRFLQSPNLTIQKIPSILWQILYTCMCLKYLKLMHYDMHLQNVAVEADTSGTPFHRKPIVYVLDKDNVFLINAKNCLVKLFDWDFGYSPRIGNNEKLKSNDCFCQAYGRCNDLQNPHYDVIHFLSLILMENLQLKPMLEAITNMPTESWVNDWPIYGKRVNQKFWNRFDPESMLKSEFFRRFRLPKGRKLRTSSNMFFYHPKLTEKSRQSIRNKIHGK